jgi:uncharacterized membrane protein YgcG
MAKAVCDMHQQGRPNSSILPYDVPVAMYLALLLSNARRDGIIELEPGLPSEQATALRQQVEQSGLLQLLPQLLQDAALLLEAEIASLDSSGGSGNGSSGSSDGSGGGSDSSNGSKCSEGGGSDGSGTGSGSCAPCAPATAILAAVVPWPPSAAPARHRRRSPAGASSGRAAG